MQLAVLFEALAAWRERMTSMYQQGTRLYDTLRLESRRLGTRQKSKLPGRALACGFRPLEVQTGNII